MDLFWRPPDLMKNLQGPVSSQYLYPMDLTFDRTISFDLNQESKRWNLIVMIISFFLIISIFNLKIGFIEKICGLLFSLFKQNKIFFVILFIGAVFRCAFLGSVPGIQGDETWSALRALSFLEGREVNLFRGMTSYTGSFYLMQAPLYILFGYNPISLRLLPAIFNILSLVFCFLLVKKIYNKQTALFSLAILIFWPITFVYSRISWEVTAFSLFFMFLSLYLIYGETNLCLLFAGITLGLGVYNHLVFACVPLAIFGIKFLETKGKIIFSKQLYLVSIPILLLFAIKQWDILLFGAGRTFDPLGIAEIVEIIRAATMDIFAEVINGTLLYKLFTGRTLVKVLPFNAIVIIFCIFILLIKRKLIDRNMLRLILFLIVTYLLIFYKAPSPRLRYFLIPGTLAGLIPAIVLGKLAQSRKRIFTICATTVVSVLVMVNVYYISVNYFLSYRKSEDSFFIMKNDKLRFSVFARSHYYVDVKKLYEYLIKNGYSKVATNYFISNNLAFWDIGNDLIICDKLRDFHGASDECLVFYEKGIPGSAAWPEELGFAGLTKIDKVKNFSIYVRNE